VRQSQPLRDQVRQILKEHGQLGCDVASLADGADLYAAGMSSRASVSVMLALESAFDVEFPDDMLRRDVFESIAAIASAIDRIRGAA
jgi:acyl carrier protein